jgi:hypothetical protein
MLNDNIKSFESNVYDILKNAMYKMIMSSFSQGEDELINSYTERVIIKTADNMAKIFADEATEPLVNEINNHIKSAGIFINVQPQGIRLIGPAGQVTGAINITPETAEIQIQ